MKSIFFFALAAGVITTQLFAQDKPVFKDQKEKASYSIGYEMGVGMRQQNLDVNSKIIVDGFRDGFSGQEPALSEDEMHAAIQAFEKELEGRMKKEAVELPEKNKKGGAAFLAENKKKEGVKVHPVKVNGKTYELQYKVLREGNGPSPKLEDRVTTHYRGTLIDGTEFDSSYKRGEPTAFGLRQVIKGWQEALQLMKVGSKWQLFVPSELAYGEAGAGRVIGPNATLIFEIELISIDKQ